MDSGKHVGETYGRIFVRVEDCHGGRKRLNDGLEMSKKCVEMVHNDKARVVENILGEQREDKRRVTWADMLDEGKEVEVEGETAERQEREGNRREMSEQQQEEQEQQKEEKIWWQQQEEQ